MSEISNLIEQERAKVRVLEKELATRKARIVALEAVPEDDGGFDSFLTSKVTRETTASAPTVAKPQHPVAERLVATRKPKRRRQRGSLKNAVMAALELSPQSTTTILTKIQGAGFEMDRHRLRAVLFNLKTAQLADSPEAGSFALSTQGAKYCREKQIVPTALKALST